MKFKSKFGLDEICIYKALDKEFLAKIICVSFSNYNVKYEIRLPSPKDSERKTFWVEEHTLEGDPDFHQKKRYN